jgi:hypothetical protein
MKSGHVDLVDIRPLFAIDLDVHVELVHHLGGRGILEAFMGHDMAPMAGGITDREQDRAVRAASFLQGFRRPRPPMHRIVGVLTKIGAGLVGQAVLAHISLAA